MPLAAGQSLAFARGKGYWAKGRALTDEEQVGKQIESVLGPLIANIKGRAATTGQNVGGIYAALAEAQKGIAPAIEQTYTNAAETSEMFSRGYSDVMKQLLGSSAAESNQLLAQQGSPQTVGGGTGAADLLYGLSGAIPGKALVREGAAMTSAAHQLPATARTLGAQAQSQVAFDADREIAKLEAERPGMVAKAMQELRELQFAEQELALKQAVAESTFGLKTRKQDFDEAATSERLSQGRERLALDRARTRFNQLAANARLDLSEANYNLAVQKEARLSKPKAKGGFTPKQKRDLQQQAFDTATDGFRGFTDEEGQEVLPRPPVEVLRDLIAAGVPFSLAIKAIQRFARDEGMAHLEGKTALDQQGREVPLADLWRSALRWTRKR